MSVESFNTTADTHTHVLILGSMPGVRSLEQNQYYAHPRNAFWPIMDALFNAGRTLDYSARLARLRACGIGLWDVARRCERPGSLDAKIVRQSVEANAFATLFSRCPALHHVFFNGQTAATLYQRFVWPQLGARAKAFTYTTLPSTSPAHARLSQADKQAQWQVVADALSMRNQDNL